MYIKPLNTKKYINEQGIMLCTTAEKNKPGSIFNREIFGVSDEDIYSKAGAISLNCNVIRPLMLNMFKRNFRVAFECATTRNNFCFNTKTGVLSKCKKGEPLPTDPDLIIDYGPSFLYKIWDKLKIETRKIEDGKVANILAYNSISKFGKDDVFTNYQWVPPLGFRDENQDSNLVVNELNQHLTDIIRYANLINDNQNLDTKDLKVFLQTKILELGEHLLNLFGSKGKIRGKLLSRTVDSSSKLVILPAMFENKSVGKSRYESDSAGMPIYHAIKMFIYLVKKNFPILMDMLYDGGYFDVDVTSDMLIVYDQNYIDDVVSKFEDNFYKVQPVEAIKSDGTFGEFIMDFTLENGETIRKPLTWIEFFYILLTQLAMITDNAYMEVTRYPVDSDKSCQFLKPIPITIMDKHLKTVSLMTFDSIEHFPLITDKIANMYDTKIFEQGLRVAASIVVAWNGDHDGDSVALKPIMSTEAVNECRNYHKQLLSIYTYTGDFGYRRGIGKSVAQTVYTFSRMPKPKDHSKKISSTHDFVKYLLSIEDGVLDTNTLHKYTRVYGKLKKPIVSLYDRCDIKYNGKTIETTIGQLIVNKVLFTRLWNFKPFEYVYVLTNKGFAGIMKELKQYVIEKDLEVSDLKRTMDLYCEFGLRLSTLYNASMTSEMLNPDETFRNYRDTELNKVKEQVLKNNDVELLEKTINKIIEWSKNYFKDNDMIELYESGGKSNWNGDFASMQIALGSLINVIGDKPAIIMNALNDGIPFEFLPDIANVGFTAAMDRGKTTALAGDLYKQFTNAFQSVLGKRGDCGSIEGEETFCTEKDKEILFNRYVLNKNGSTTKITTKNVNKYINKKIVLRSPSKCKMKDGHFCSTCVGTALFDFLNDDTVNLGLYTNDLGSKILNLFMAVTHDLKAHYYKINDFNEFVYPRPKKDLFYNKVDPIDGIEKVYCNEDIEWKVPKSAVTAIDTAYSVLAHGSILETSGKTASIIFGTEVTTNPYQIFKPESSGNQDKKHYIFNYKKDDCFLNKTSSIKSTLTVYKMIKLYLRGTVSNLIPLEAHFKTLQNTFKTNKNLGDSDLSVSIVLASLSRDIKNIYKTARETGTKDYVMIGADDLISISNTFNGVIGPDAVRSIFIAQSRSYKDQVKNTSPLEKAFQN